MAGDVFGRLGFKASTVREICRLAGASVAAVNYHFRDKESLYRTVLRDLMRSGVERYPPDMGLGPDPTLEERLHAFIRATLFRLLGEKGWYGSEGSGRLMAQELLDPSPSLDHVVEEYLRPLMERLVSIVGEFLGPRVPADDVRRCALSIIGQCMHHAVGSPVISRLGLTQGREKEAIERLAEHITRFSLGGLRHTRAALEAGGDSPGCAGAPPVSEEGAPASAGGRP